MPQPIIYQTIYLYILRFLERGNFLILYTKNWNKGGRWMQEKWFVILQFNTFAPGLCGSNVKEYNFQSHYPQL